MTNKLTKQLNKLPNKTGIYIFKNKTGKILYVGKAKNLKKRISSYFKQLQNLSKDKSLMTEQIKDIEYTTTNSENDALLLESNLIKQYKPQYNVVLKDDKQYKYIKIDYEDDFPRLYTVRKITDDKASYFGPFTDARALKQTLKLIRKLFPYRDCNQNIFYDNGKELKKKVCLKYHIKKCLGPCIGAVSKEEYNSIIRKCELFLLGRIGKLVKDLKKEMQVAAQGREFEKAAALRDQIESIEKITAEQIVVSTRRENQDYISFVRNRNRTFINLFIIRDGKLIGKENFTLSSPLKTKNSEILESFVKQYYSTAFDAPKEIICQYKVDNEKNLINYLSQKFGKKTRIKKAFRGKGRKLIEMGMQNAEDYMKSKMSPATDSIKIKTLKQIQKTFSLKNLPKRIECYDISNIQGNLATGSMVVFTNGQPDKNEYRRFKIKTVKSVNDTAMIKETLSRRLRNRQWKYPDLIILDGGRAQLNVIIKELEDKNVRIPVLALAKKKEEIFSTKSKSPISLPKTSKVLHLLQQIRDEAHRFAISYHKILRKKMIFN
jgi:excinuclease ABC subunit C